MKVTQMTTRYQRAQTALWRRSADAVVVLPADGDDAFTLRGSGSALWEVLAQPRTLDETAESLAAAFDRPVHTIAEEIEPVLRELVRRKAVLQT